MADASLLVRMRLLEDGCGERHSSEMKRSGIERVSQRKLHLSGGDAQRGNTRSHPEHDG